jgi:hypothetical protein
VRLGRRPPEAPRRPARVLTASGRRINLTDRNAQGPQRLDWQRQAWDYRDSIGEIRYAMKFLAEAVSRVRVVPSVAELDGAPPTPLSDVGDLPEGLEAAVEDAMARLTADTHNWGALLRPLAVNMEVPGEAWLIGREVDDQEIWEIRSSSEVKKTDRGWTVLDDDGKTDLPIGQDGFVARLWTPHDEYRHLADSPMRALLGPCEELQLACRMIRGAARSRFAGAGVLSLPAGMDFASAGGDEEDPEEAEQSTFIDELARAMTTSIQDEGDASALVPIVVEAEAEAIAAVKHLTFGQEVDTALADRDKSLARIGAGLDVPPEIITGMSDANHWSAWQVDSSTIRNHVEPLIARMLDALTVAYLRPALLAEGFEPTEARRVILWYDVAPLTIRPNRLDDAIKLHTANPTALSTDAMLEAGGWDPDADKPDDEEIAARVAWARGTVDATLMEKFVELVTKLQFPEAPAPPVAPPPLVPSQQVPELPAGDAPTTPQPDTGLPVAASAAPQGPVLRAYRRESERLSRIDRETRERLAAAADAALDRAVEKAAARARSAAQKTPEGRALAASGEPLVAALGLDPDALLQGAWDQLRGVWDRLTEAARVDAAATAGRIAGQPPQVGVVGALSQLAAQGWEWFTAALTREAVRTLEDPEADTGVAEEPGEDPGRPGRVTSLARGALAIAGGLPAGHPGIADDGTVPGGGTPPGGIASGDVLGGYLAGAGREVIGYEWVYGISKNHFEPHRRLDGTLFPDFASPLLQNPEPWPSPTLAPGDHRGCRCDASPVWADGRLASLEQDAAVQPTYDDSYMAVLRGMADADRAAGRTDTSPIRAVEEAERVANARPSRRP